MESHLTMNAANNLHIYLKVFSVKPHRSKHLLRHYLVLRIIGYRLLKTLCQSAF